MTARRSSRESGAGAGSLGRGGWGAGGRGGAEAGTAGLAARAGLASGIERGGGRLGVNQPYSNTNAAPSAGAIATRPGASAFAQWPTSASETAMSPAIQPSSAAPIAMRPGAPRTSVVRISPP